MDAKIEPLHQHTKHLPVLAAWHQQQWGPLNPAKTVASRIEEFKAHLLTDDAVPSTWCAVADGEVLGSASLIVSDLDTRPELSPWLASVFVAPEYRGQGVGSALVQKIMAAAGRESIRTLYLYTLEHEAWYQQMGWRTFEKTTHNGHAITIMSVLVN